MVFEGLERKKFPRLLLAHPDEAYEKVTGCYFVWPRGGRSQVLDISYAGLAISSSGILDKVKMDEFIEAHLILPTPDLMQIPISVRVVRKTAGIIGFRIDSVSPEGRIKIDQSLKDVIVIDSLRSLSPTYLQAGMRSDFWYHGPFDTNFFIWKSDSTAKKIVIEYDNSVLVFEEGKVSVARTSAATEESLGYCGPFLAKDFGKQKLSLGHGWAQRLVALVKQSSLKGTVNETQLVAVLQSVIPPED